MRICKSVLCVSLILFLTAAFQGCGSGAKQPDWLPKLTPCKITLVQEGKPVGKASLSIVAPAGTPPLEWLISGFTDDKGVAYPSVQSFKGIPQGEYIVTVEKFDNEFTNDVDHPMNAYLVVDPKYGSATTSTLKLIVGETPIDQTFDLGKPVRIKRKN